MRSFIKSLTFLSAMVLAACSGDRDFAGLVDPFIGTDTNAHCHPCAAEVASHTA